MTILRSDARVAEGGALLRRYTGLNPYRGFESLSLRQHHMEVSMTRFICRILILSVLALPYSMPAQAAMVGTGEAVAAAQVQADRDQLRDFVARAEVQEQLAALGVSPATAQERVA